MEVKGLAAHQSHDLQYIEDCDYCKNCMIQSTVQNPYTGIMQFMKLRKFTEIAHISSLEIERVHMKLLGFT